MDARVKAWLDTVEFVGFGFEGVNLQKYMWQVWDIDFEDDESKIVIVALHEIEDEDNEDYGHHGQIYDDDNPSDLADFPGCNISTEIYGDEYGE